MECWKKGKVTACKKYFYLEGDIIVADSFSMLIKNVVKY